MTAYEANREILNYLRKLYEERGNLKVMLKIMKTMMMIFHQRTNQKEIKISRKVHEVQDVKKIVKKKTAKILAQEANQQKETKINQETVENNQKAMKIVKKNIAKNFHQRINQRKIKKLRKIHDLQDLVKIANLMIVMNPHKRTRTIDENKTCQEAVVINQKVMKETVMTAKIFHKRIN